MPDTTLANTILEVAVPSPLRQHFDYLAPGQSPVGGWQPGLRVRVPFGRREIVGVVLGSKGHSELPSRQLKRAIDCPDPQPVLPADLLQLILRAADYYHHPLGDALSTALPTLLRKGEDAAIKGESWWRLTASGNQTDPDELKRAPKQAQLLKLLAAHPDGLARDAINEQLNNPSATLRALRDKQLVEEHQHLPLLTGSAGTAPSLHAEQQAAVDVICRGLGQFQCSLLDGVTGSGKTEVYLRAIQQCLARNQQVLMLVPEIGLTPQLIQRFQQRCPATIAVLHSGLSERDRLNAWLAARDGSAQIVIGTRSAVFVPLANPGLFIVDEEHDTSLKQQDGFRYHGRDLLVLRAQQSKVPIVLGSATPSLESLNNARQGRYQHLRLTERAGNAAPPKMALLDVRALPMDEGLSSRLQQQMRQHLDKHGQVLLFLNRRGFAPTLICHECGWVAECSRCDVHFTLHQQQHHLRCHHCDAQRPIPHQCPGCGSSDLRPIGTGTERIEQALKRLFPDVSQVRIDRDSTRNKGELDKRLALAESGEARLLLGTQMLAKGHHFPNVTLVAILDVDQGLFSADFRASERMAQLIVQVAGRAGRAERAGEVVIQTHHPDHPLLLQLAGHGYAAFARDLLAEREATQLPPFSYMALLRAEATHAGEPEQFLEQAHALADRIGLDVQLWGPVAAPMPRRAGRFRAQLGLIANERQALQRLLRELVPAIAALKAARKVRWSIDVDPVDTY